MGPEETKTSDLSLRKVLREWETNDPLPPRFEERVWQRIAREEAEAPARLWKRWLNRLGRTFSRPGFAVGYVTALLLAGLAAGYWQAHVDRARTVEELGARYVQMVDPYLMPQAPGK